MTKHADKMGPRDYPALKKLVEDMTESDKRMMNASRRKRSELIVNTLVRIVTNGRVNSNTDGRQHPYGMIGIITEIDDCEIKDYKPCKLYRVLADNDEFWYFEEELEVIKVGAIIK